MRCTALILAVVSVASVAQSALWQYTVPAGAGKALLWIPPSCETVRGLFTLGKLGIEGELVRDPEVRRACTEANIGVVYFEPHLSATFPYWKPDSTDTQRWLKAFDDLAVRSGHPEIRRVPWITAGHSTAGIFCRNVAYWKPERVAGVLHIKSGNFHQKDIKPPGASLAGVPLLAINGQFESFGPEGGLRPEFGRETQWVFVLRDIQTFRQEQADCLMSLLVQPGDDHFHGAPELGAYAALFIRKTAQYRIPAALPAGDAPVTCLPLKAADGWLTDPDIKHPTHPAAPYADYSGDKSLALWHVDGELARANAAFHTNMANDQVLGNPECAWLDEGDGWTFRAKTAFLDAIPAKYGGPLAGKAIGHASTPPVLRCKKCEPVAQLGPDTFRALRAPTGKNPSFNICAYHPGDTTCRATYRWGSLSLPRVRGKAQAITFPAVGDLPADACDVALKATADSGLPVYYEVDYGPIAVRDGCLRVDEIPARARYPMECAVTAYQIGRRLGEVVEPASPVTQVFRVVQP